MIDKITELIKLEFDKLPKAFICDNKGFQKVNIIPLNDWHLEKQMGGKIEKIHYLKNENYFCYQVKDSVKKNLPYNFSMFILTGYDLYGKILFIKRRK